MERCFCALIFGVLLLTACVATPTPEPTVQPTPTLEPTAVPEGLSLYYEGNAQIELVSPAGVRIMLDVFKPEALIQPATAQDVLLSTHSHPDHYSQSFAESFPGKSMLLERGGLELGDVKIRAVLSAGAYYDQHVPDSNTVYVIEMGGLRVAHLGDLAQTELTAEQLEVLQGVDVLIFAFESQYGDMTLENQNGFNLVKAIQPKLVIPTHHTTAKGIEYAADLWAGYAVDAPLQLSRADLPAETKLLVLGSMADSYKSLYKLSDWPGKTK